MRTSMIYNNFLVIFHTVHMKTSLNLDKLKGLTQAMTVMYWILVFLSTIVKQEKQTINKQTQKPSLEQSLLCHIHHMLQSAVLRNFQIERLL